MGDEGELACPTKVATVLTAGGYHAKHAKALAAVIHDNSAVPITPEGTDKLYYAVNVNTDKMIPNEVCAWANTDNKYMRDGAPCAHWRDWHATQY